MLSIARSQRRRPDQSRPGGGARLAVCLATALGILSPTVSAQRDAFRDALIAFHANLKGDYGDEGPLVIENLEKMASGLTTWDGMIQADERDLRSRLPTAGTGDQLRIRMALARLYLERGRYRDGIRELDAAIQVDGNRGNVHVSRGLALEALGRQEDAIGAFRRAWELDHDDPVSAYLLAASRAARARAGETTPQAAALLKIHERRLASVPSDRHVPLFPELALVYDRSAVTPVFSPALYADGLTLIAEGRYQEAIASLRSATAHDPLVVGGPWTERLRPGIARLREGDVDNAITHLEAASMAAPRSSEIHRILAGAYGEAGNDAKSLEHLETAAGLAPDDERVSLALGRALEHAGQVERAERVLLDTSRRLPQSTDAHSALADLYEASNQGRRALHELEVAASFTVLAGKGSLYLRLADLQHRHLEYERVIDPLARRSRLNPNDARVHTDLGLAYTRIGRTNDALIELLVASVIGPDDAETLTAIGQIHFDAGNYAEAERVLRRAIAIAPALLQARYTLGQTLARLGQANESKEQLGEFDRLRAAAHDKARRSFEIDMLRQEALRETNAGRHDGAVSVWQKLAEREPKRPEPRIALAGALIRAGRPTEAVGHLETAATLGADLDVYRQLAELYATLGRGRDSTAARQTYQRLLQERRRGDR